MYANVEKMKDFKGINNYKFYGFIGFMMHVLHKNKKNMKKVLKDKPIEERIKLLTCVELKYEDGLLSRVRTKYYEDIAKLQELGVIYKIKRGYFGICTDYVHVLDNHLIDEIRAYPDKYAALQHIKPDTLLGFNITTD